MVDLNISLDESIYMDMYTWGLKHIDIAIIETQCKLIGKPIRKKDYDNYWRGYYRSYFREDGGYWKSLMRLNGNFSANQTRRMMQDYWDYPLNPLDRMPDVKEKWVPCSSNNKPLIPWSKYCLRFEEAVAYKNQVYLGENMRGQRLVVIDCDGDHNENDLDLETIYFLWQYSFKTHTLVKQKYLYEYGGYENVLERVPASFHLTFTTNRVIPSMHFPWCHIDILGNENNQLRYWKTKQWNGKLPMQMDDIIWNEIKEYVERRKDG